MGQYYKAVLSRSRYRTKMSVDYFASALQIHTGAKLMEHSYINNNMVLAAECKIYNNAMRVAWCGDYADEETNGKFKDKTMYSVVGAMEDDNAESLVPNYTMLGDDNFTEEETWCGTTKYYVPDEPAFRYLCNKSKRIFVDLTEIEADQYGCRIHPLPLLTAEGNDRGGGDYHSRHGKRYVGTWHRDYIFTADEVPDGYKKRTYKFKED